MCTTEVATETAVKVTASSAWPPTKTDSGQGFSSTYHIKSKHTNETVGGKKERKKKKKKKRERRTGKKEEKKRGANFKIWNRMQAFENKIQVQVCEPLCVWG